MRTIRLVLLLTAVCGYVNAYNCIDDAGCENNKKCLPGCETNAETPTCTDNCASSSKDCVWQCQKSNSPIAGDTTVCRIAATTCGMTGTCKAVCDTTPVCPTACETSKVCSMTCQAPPVSPPDDPPTTTTTDPTTTTTATAPKSGSPRIELFTPLLVLGTLTKMCFSP